MSGSSGRFRLTSWAAKASAAVAGVGIVCLVLLYAGLGLEIRTLQRFGPLNDLCVVLQYALALPVVRAFHRMLAPHAPGRIRVATLAAVTGILGTGFLQSLLLTGRMTFAEQVPYVSITVLLIGVWIVITGTLGRRLGRFPFGMPSVWLAALYFGYPVWMYRVGQQFAKPRQQPAGGSR